MTDRRRVPAEGTGTDKSEHVSPAKSGKGNRVPPLWDKQFQDGNNNG